MGENRPAAPRLMWAATSQHKSVGFVVLTEFPELEMPFPKPRRVYL